MSEHTYDHSGTCFKECLANPFRAIGAKYPGEFSHQYSNLLGGHSDHYVGFPGEEVMGEMPGQNSFDTRLVLSVPQWLDNLTGQSKAGVTAGYVQQVSADGWGKQLKLSDTDPTKEYYSEVQIKEWDASYGWATTTAKATNKYLDCTRVKQYLAGEMNTTHFDTGATIDAAETGPPSGANDEPHLQVADTVKFIRNAPIEVLRYTKFGIRITTDAPKEMMGGHYWYCLVNGSEHANLSEVDSSGDLRLMTQDQCIESIVATRGWKKVPCGNGTLDIVLSPMERRSFMYSQALLPSANDMRVAAHATSTDSAFFPEPSSVDYKSQDYTAGDGRAASRMSMGLWQKLLLYSTARNVSYGTNNARSFVPLSIEFYYCVEYVPPIGTLGHLSATPPAGKGYNPFSSAGGEGKLYGRRMQARAPARRTTAPPRRTNMAAIASHAAQLMLPHLVSFAADRLRNGGGKNGKGTSKKKKKHVPQQQPARRQPQARGRARGRR